MRGFKLNQLYLKTHNLQKDISLMADIKPQKDTQLYVPVFTALILFPPLFNIFLFVLYVVILLVYYNIHNIFDISKYTLIKLYIA